MKNLRNIIVLCLAVALGATAGTTQAQAGSRGSQKGIRQTANQNQTALKRKSAAPINMTQAANSSWSMPIAYELFNATSNGAPLKALFGLDGAKLGLYPQPAWPFDEAGFDDDITGGFAYGVFVKANHTWPLTDQPEQMRIHLTSFTKASYPTLRAVYLLDWASGEYVNVDTAIATSKPYGAYIACEANRFVSPLTGEIEMAVMFWTDNIAAASRSAAWIDQIAFEFAPN